MPDSDKKIKHFIFSRFFTYQRVGFPYNVLEVDFLSKQLPLVKNMLKSLENQTSKNFELIFLTNPEFFYDPKYEFIFSTLRSYTVLPINFIKFTGDTLSYQDSKVKGLWKFKENKNVELGNLIASALNDYDFVITTKMDFDDFVFKDAVIDTQSKVNECNSILAYGYNKGLEYIYGELYPRTDFLWKGRGHIGIFQSLILKSSSVENYPFLSVQNFWHDCIKIQLEQFLKNNGIEFLKDMFQQNFSTCAYIYLRHEFSQEHLVKSRGKPLQSKVSKQPPLTAKYITKEQLKSDFGFDGYELNSIK